MYAQEESSQLTIDRIVLKGITVWSRSNVMSLIKASGLKKGKSYSTGSFQRRVEQAIERLYQQGLFSDIRTRYDKGTLIFNFEERAKITNIKFRGNKDFNRQKMKDVILLQRGQPASESLINSARREIRNFYRSKGYQDVQVSVKREKTASGRVVLTFNIDEGNQKIIRNVYINYKQEKYAFSLIPHNWSLKWSLPVKKGDPYAPQKLKEARIAITRWYHNRGYLDVSIRSKTSPNPLWPGVDLTLVIDEGPIYTMGTVNFENNSVFTDEQLQNMITLDKGDLFVKRQFLKSLQKIEKRYKDKGYANASVFDPSRFSMKKDRENLEVNFDVQIKESHPFYVERIEIRGNEATYDKVIRREITLESGGLLNGKKKRNSIRRLRNLGYFEKVKFNVDPGSDQDLKVVRVEVKERPTGQLQFGGGYSSSSGFLGNFSVKKDNFSLYDYSSGFTGRGQSIEASASIGDQRDNFSISWDDPWFNDDLDEPSKPSPDVPISFGWSLFNQINRRDQGYDEVRKGGSLSLGKEFGEALSNKVDVSYSFRSIQVDDLEDANDPPLDIKNEAGSDSEFERGIGTLEFGIQRDRRDDRRFPSDGYFLRASTAFAEDFFGGNSQFYK
ncbi:MAG: outer membrane protein assembly factor BamA, partial [bacterium]